MKRRPVVSARILQLYQLLTLDRSPKADKFTVEGETDVGAAAKGQRRESTHEAYRGTSKYSLSGRHSRAQ